MYKLAIQIFKTLMHSLINEARLVCTCMCVCFEKEKLISPGEKYYPPSVAVPNEVRARERVCISRHRCHAYIFNKLYTVIFTQRY